MQGSGDRHTVERGLDERLFEQDHACDSIAKAERQAVSTGNVGPRHTTRIHTNDFG
jgi:hypothetical protein